LTLRESRPAEPLAEAICGPRRAQAAGRRVGLQPAREADSSRSVRLRR